MHKYIYLFSVLKNKLVLLSDWRKKFLQYNFNVITCQRGRLLSTFMYWFDVIAKSEQNLKQKAAIFMLGSI